MTESQSPVRPIDLAAIAAARERIASTIFRTPLVQIDLGPGQPDIRLKLENLQPINAYKLRGAANAVAMLVPRSDARGVWTISAGNAGQGVAYAARKAGVPCTVVAIETAPKSKLERMRALGATLVTVPYERCWQALDDRAYPGRRRNVHPSVRRPRFHRGARHDGPRDPGGRAGRHGRYRGDRRRRAHDGARHCAARAQTRRQGVGRGA